MEFFFNTNIQFYILAYLVGGIPFGLLLAKYYGHVNVTEVGSGSIGATNVLRALKTQNPKLAKQVAIATLVLDVFKGIIILALAKFIAGVSPETLWTIAILSVIGHCYSPYLKFEGGKGVATGMGVMFFMLPVETLIALVVWFLFAKTIKISSLSSLSGLLALVIASFIIHPNIPQISTHAPIIIITFIIFYKHIPNIIRIFKGEETRVV
ncbi:glycerol-3-phosphate 1-O-acyltransferase PlsY [Sulfurospirillum sp. 1612]|uniref:glycerol-3-phosphate 1-O-acyltransferase PlsY n=1 Tax=Sulfurospirillum sp. 1612 TaxID=3094835 RepID=UPI002F939DEB